MSRTNLYIDLKGHPHSLNELDGAERQVIRDCETFIRKTPEWSAYHNFWLPLVDQLYSARGLSKQAIIQSSVYRIAQDLGSRLQIALGEATAPDYRDQLAELIRNQYATKREFCNATGLSEDMLSHVLSHRKHLSMDTLTEALGKIGYMIHIQPLPDINS